jgi:epoxyqueuosine reductase
MEAEGDLKARIVARAEAEGFARAGVTRPDAAPEVAERLAAFLAEGRHGQMTWMAERSAWRGDPAALWPEARSVVMLAEPYTPEDDPLEVLGRPDRGGISVYARNRDYHDLVKKRLKRVARWMVAETGCAVKVFVDTAPVPEKALGEAAGLGWQGKHTNLLSRELGNWFFLGAIFTTLELEPDRPGQDHCGSCRACLDICPTDAFPAPYQLDARRCISYLTIEHRGPVDLELREKMGNRIYGCDDCLAVCPWNKFAVAAREMGYAAREALARTAAGRTRPARRRGVPGDVRGQPDQADRAGPVRAQRPLCHRQLGAAGTRRGRRGFDGRPRSGRRGGRPMGGTATFVSRVNLC